MSSTLPVNLRRLIFWHHKSAKEFAEMLGTTERTVSAWLTGRREPSYSMAMKMAKVYGIDPSLLGGDPAKFGNQLADRTATSTSSGPDSCSPRRNGDAHGSGRWRRRPEMFPSTVEKTCIGAQQPSGGNAGSCRGNRVPPP